MGHHPSPSSNPLTTLIHHRSKTNQSQCSTESGILADLSMSYDDPSRSESSGRSGRSGRSNGGVDASDASDASGSSSSNGNGNEVGAGEGGSNSTEEVHRRVGRSDSSMTTLSADSVTVTSRSMGSSPLTSSESCPCPFPSHSLSSSVSLYVNNKLMNPTSQHSKHLPTTEM